jgi:hypothetical protein
MIIREDNYDNYPWLAELINRPGGTISTENDLVGKVKYEFLDEIYDAVVRIHVDKARIEWLKGRYYINFIGTVSGEIIPKYEGERPVKIRPYRGTFSLYDLENDEKLKLDRNALLDDIFYEVDNHPLSH